MSAATEESGVFLVRAWQQEGRLVARMCWSVPGVPEQHVEAVSGTHQVELALRRWLELVEPPADPGR